MFKNILLPLALNDRESSVVSTAISLAGLSSAAVCLVHVIETLQDTTFEELKDFYAGLQERAEAGLNRVEAQFQQEGVQSNSKVLFGNRTSQVLQCAEQIESDLIILGSHQVHPNDPTPSWGTVSYKVGILARCPVLLVK